MNRLTKLFASALCVAALALTACGGGDAGAPPSDIDQPTTAPPPDTTPPTVGIFNNMSVLPATGPVTFTFVFNEDVGSSFNASAITVSGGTAGTLDKASATQYTMVVTPPAGTSGTLSVAVRAGGFSDLAGNINVVVPPAAEVPFGSAGGGGGSGSTGTCTGTNCTTFSEPGIGFGPFENGGGGSVGIVNDPNDASNQVVKFVKKPGDGEYFGTTITGLAAPAVLTASNKTVTMRVFSPAVGTNMLLKFEGGTGGPAQIEKDAVTTVANAWETLSFVMTDAGTYTTVVVFPNGRSKVTADTTIFIDELKFPAAAAGGGSSGNTGTCTGTNCTTFSEQGIGFGPFENAGGGTVGIENDPKDASNKAVKFVKKPGDGEYFGTTITGLAAPAVLTASNKTVTMRVFSPAVGTNMLLKFEGGTGGPAQIEKDAVTTVANAWETLSFVMTDAGTYTTVVVFPNGRSKVTADTTIFIDELKFPAAAGGGGGGTPVKLITFDEVPSPKLTDFGTNGAGATIEVDPAGGTNKVLKVNKFLTPAPGSEQWAGTTISTGPNDSIATIPFTDTAKTMTARVYSPAVGVRVRLKVENASNVNITAETDAITTTSGAWEVLTFNFANPGTNPPVGGGATAALDPAQTYNKLSIFMDFGLGNGGGPLPANRVYYADDISFVPAAGGGGGGAAPATFSAGFSAANLTANGGGFGGFSGSNQDNFGCSGDPAFCGSGGNFTGDAASEFFYYYQTPTPATALYMGIYVLAPGVKDFNNSGDTAGVDVGSRANLKFTLGQNAEWFNGTAKNFMIVVDLGKRYVAGGNTCRLQLRNVTTPTAQAATAYSIPWSSFEVVQNCGTSISTAAAALAASPVSQIAFQGVGGTAALSAGGKTSGANLTIPTAPPVVYPTTLVVRGAITFE
jgi:Bacterial Ig-like domain